AIGRRVRWGLDVVAIATFAGEWAWRRRQGLPERPAKTGEKRGNPKGLPRGRGERGRVVNLALGTSVKYLKGVGPKRAEALARLGVRTMGDLLYHAPHRYLDATRVTPLAQARVGA